MKKTITMFLVGTLLLPSLTFAQPLDGTVANTEPSPMQATLYSEGGERPAGQPVQKEVKRPIKASTTRAQVEQKREEIKTIRGDVKASSTNRGDMRASSTNRGDMRASSTNRNVGFCSQIDKALVYLDTKAINFGEKKEDAVNNRTEKREDHRSEVDTRRADNEVKRNNQLEELSKRATTDAQKAALEAFRTSMNTALTERKKTVDAILLAHRTDIDKVVAARKTGAGEALVTLKADIEAVKTQAKSDCTNNIAGDTVRTNLKNAIQKAQEKFRETMKSLEKVKDVSEASRETRKQELQKAEDTFKKSVEDARNNLKAALKASRPVATSTTTQ